MMLFKKIEYNSLKTKVDNTDTTKFVLRTKYEKDGSDFEDDISKTRIKNSEFNELTEFNVKVT